MMQPGPIKALEILVDEAATAGELSQTFSSFRLSHPQLMLGISKHIAYIASLVLHMFANPLPPFTTEQEQCFAKLQIRYHLKAGSPAPVKIYKLSLALCPLQTAQGRYLESNQPKPTAGNSGDAGQQSPPPADTGAETRSVRVNPKELADEACRELLAQEAASKASSSSKPRAVAAAKARGSWKPKASAPANNRADQSERSVAEELDELVQARLQPLAEHEFDAREWVLIRRRSAGPRPEPVVEAETERSRAKGALQPKCVSSLEYGDEQDEPSVAPAGSLEERSAVSQHAHQSKQTQVVSDAKLEVRLESWEADVQAEGAPPSQRQQQQQQPNLAVESRYGELGVEELQHQLRTRDRQLQALEAEMRSRDRQLKALEAEMRSRDRQLKAVEAEMRSREHELTSQLAEAQDKAEARVRALQFRLYITNNRVRILEEALVEHVNAVGLQSACSEPPQAFEACPEEQPITSRELKVGA